MAGAVVEGPEVGRADGVVFQLLSVVKIAIIRDIRIAECKAEGVVVGTLQDGVARADDRPNVAEMVGNVVLRRIGSRTWIPCQLAVRGQDEVDRQACVIDEVAAVDVLHRPSLLDRQFVAIGVVDIVHGAGVGGYLDPVRQFDRAIGDRQPPEAVGLHRAVGIVCIRFLDDGHHTIGR